MGLGAFFVLIDLIVIAALRMPARRPLSPDCQPANTSKKASRRTEGGAGWLMIVQSLCGLPKRSATGSPAPFSLGSLSFPGRWWQRS